MDNNIFNINDELEKFKYYADILDKYSFKKTTLLCLEPLDLNKQKILFDNLIKDKEFIDFILKTIDKKVGKNGIIYFYNAIYYNIKDYLSSILDIDNLKIDWDEELINTDFVALKVFIDNFYCGDINFLNKTYSTANPEELKNIIKEAKNLEFDYNKYNDELINLLTKIKTPRKKDFAHRWAFTAKDPLEKEKKRYDTLLIEKAKIGLKLDDLNFKYNEIYKKINKNSEINDMIFKNIKEKINFEIIEYEAFPIIDTYEFNEEEYKEEKENEVSKEIFTEINEKFKYN